MARGKSGKEWKLEIYAFWTYFFIVDILLTSVLLYAFGGVLNSENFTSWLFYNVTLIGAGGFWTGMKVFRNDPDTDGHPLNDVFQFVSFHDPEKSVLGRAIPFLGRNREFFLFWTAVAIFIGIGVTTSGTFVSGTPEYVVSGSISDVVSVGLSLEPTVSSETVFFNGLLTYIFAGMFYWGIVKFAGERQVNKRGVLAIAFILGVLLSGFTFLQYHNVQYPSSEASQLGVLALGLITSGLAVLSGSLYPSWAIHGSGNVFKSILGTGASPVLTTVATAVFFILFVAGYRLVFKPRFLKGIAYE